MMAASRTSCSLGGVVPLDPRPRQLSDGEISAYMALLHLPREAVAEPSPKALASLQQAHLDNVSYENLDLHCGLGGTPRAPPGLDPHLSLERVVAQRRGGYCFIIVDAFASLLTSLGFVVSMHNAGCGEIPLPLEKWGNHVVLLVHFAGPSPFCYVADVGLGDGPSSPFRLEAQCWEEGGFTYSLKQLDQEGHWRFTHDPKGSFACFEVNLSTSAAGAHEFSAYHKHYYQSSDSSYRKSGVVALRRGVDEGNTGILFKLHNLTFTTLKLTSKNTESSVRRVANRAEWLGILQVDFNLPLEDLASDEHEALWDAARSHQLQRDGTAAAKEAATANVGAE